MAGDVVLVVDMLVGFLEPGHPLYCGDGARGIIPEVVRLLSGRPWAKIIYLADNHDPDDAEFAMFPPHCVKGTAESRLIPELEPFPGLVIPKTRYSGFHGTNLETVLSDIRPDTVAVTGVCTDICVCHTVADLRNRDYRVIVPASCVASFDDEAHRFALKHMATILGATVV